MEFRIMVIWGKGWERQKFEIRRDMTSCLIIFKVLPFVWSDGFVITYYIVKNN